MLKHHHLSFTCIVLLFSQVCYSGELNSVKQGLTLQALRVDTGEAVWPVKWELRGNDQIYHLTDDSATLDLSRLQATELLAGDYTATAYSGDFAGSANFTLPIDKSVVYVDLYRDVPPISLEIRRPIVANKALSVSWVGPAKPNDLLVIVPAGGEYWQMFESVKLSGRNPSTLTAPEHQGHYDLLYLSISHGAVRVEAREAFTIEK